MSYYILPKIHNKIKISPFISENKIEPCISQTFIQYYNTTKNEILNNYYADPCISIDNLKQFINPYEYIFSKVPGSNFSVSKLKPKSILFYDLYEIIQNINLLDVFKYEKLNSLIIGDNYEDSLECLEMLRENYNEDKFFCFYEYNLDLHNWIKDNKFNFIIYEINNFENINDYILKLIEILILIINFLNENSMVIIKINNLIHKPIIDIVYLLTSLFEKTYIIKPNTSNITTFDRYIILKNFNCKNDKDELLNNYNTILSNFLYEYKTSNKNINSIIQFDLPYYFLNKIDDINLIIGQQQLDLFDQIINILLSKNKEDKLETLKKNNIQKCVQWCEKYKIPCNKFSEKINIFLPVKKPAEYKSDTFNIIISEQTNETKEIEVIFS
jgi:hypothetical protein